MRFIRKHGRVIPIREEGDKKPVHAGKVWASGLGSALAGHAVGTAVHLATASKPTQEQIDKLVAANKKKYPDLYAKAGNLKVLQSPVSVTTLKGTHEKIPGNKNFKYRREPLIGLNTLNESVLMHEVGHVAKSREKGTVNRSYRKFQTDAMRGNMTTGRLIRFMHAKPYTMLKLEAEATGEVFKHAAKAGGARAVLKHAKVLVPAYASYALFGAGNALQLVGMGLAIKHQLQKRKQRDR